MEGTSQNKVTFNLVSLMEVDNNENAAAVDNNYETNVEEDLQLSLGLSIYGVDPACNKLKRSSTSISNSDAADVTPVEHAPIATSITNLDVSDAADVARVEQAPIARAVSEPVDNEEEVRRRKADQSAGRLEVKNKIHWKKCKFARGIVIDNNNASENNEVIAGNAETSEQVAAVHQGSVGSQKAGSSAVYGQQIIEGTAQNGEDKSPSSVQSVEMQAEQALTMQADAPMQAAQAPLVQGNACGRNGASLKAKQAAPMKASAPGRNGAPVQAAQGLTMQVNAADTNGAPVQAAQALTMQVNGAPVQAAQTLTMRAYNAPVQAEQAQPMKASAHVQAAQTLTMQVNGAPVQAAQTLTMRAYNAPVQAEQAPLMRANAPGRNGAPVQAEQATPMQTNAPVRNGVLMVQAEQAPPVQANAPGTDGTRNNRTLVSTPLLDMPYVSTTGGVNMVSGFLYKYERGENVKIVCVCHGLFLSPAEFVRHGGGGEVDNPLKHIVVNGTPLF